MYIFSKELSNVLVLLAEFCLPLLLDSFYRLGSDSMALDSTISCLSILMLA